MTALSALPTIGRNAAKGRIEPFMTVTAMPPDVSFSGWNQLKRLSRLQTKGSEQIDTDQRPGQSNKVTFSLS